MEDNLQSKVQQLQAELDSLHKAICVVNQLAAELDIHTAMVNVRNVALELLDCQRVTLFLIFERRKELRAMIDQSEILRIKFGEGIAGLVAQTGGSMNLHDVYAHPMFNKEIDRLTGFRTRNMLCMAVSDMTGKNVAVLQALNKAGGPFTAADERNLRLFGTHLGNTLVKAKLHERAKREKERLAAIYNCFKALNSAEEVGQMVTCATAALERDIIHAERVFFFLVDAPRGELWLHTQQAESLRLRLGQGVVGECAATKKARTWAEFGGPESDPALRRLTPLLGSPRIKSLLVQPIHGTNNDRVLAVVLAINKREAEGTSDIFFEPFFTEADCDAMALFAYEVGDLLSERSLELSLLSALSVVGHDGANPNSRPHGHDGVASDTGGGFGSPGCSSVMSGDEDLIRSQLIQMYLPEYKKEHSSSHSMFSRSSFTAANVTANQVRASLERKRSSRWAEGTAFARRGSPRQRDSAPSGRLGLAVAAAVTRSTAWANRMQAGGVHVEDRMAADSVSDLYGDGTRRVGSAASAGTAVCSESDALEPGSLRCASSSLAELPARGGSFTFPAGNRLAMHGRSASGRETFGRSTRASSLQYSGKQCMSAGGAGVGPAGSRQSACFGRMMPPWWRSPSMSHGAEGLTAHALAQDALASASSSDEESGEQNGRLAEEDGDEEGLESHGLGASGRDGSSNGWTRAGALHCSVGPGPPSPREPPDEEGDALRLVSEASLHVPIADPQALRTHLSCTDLTASASPRQPCFYPEASLLSWEWDFTEYNVEELIKLAYDTFIMSGVMEEFAIKPKVMRNFLTAVASHYHHVPYHNFNHVCHVLHATFLIGWTTQARDILLPIERLGLMLAALCHDLDHDGHSNSFHVNTGSELARIYNDQSVMENHHCAMSFAIMSRPDCNVLAALEPEEQRAVRKVVISAILCTDMANHFALTQEFQKHSATYDKESEADRLLLLKVILHAADIGNAVRPFHVNHAMSRRVHREFEMQAAEEVGMGLPITFSVDTSDHVMCARVELNFLDYVVTTLWERLTDVLPELELRLTSLRINRTRYRRIADTGKTADQVLAEEAQEQEHAAAAASAASALATVRISEVGPVLEGSASLHSAGVSIFESASDLCAEN